jgi:putative hemolysin
MQASPSRLPFSLAPILPAALRGLAEPLQPALHRLLIPDPVMEGLEAARRSGTGGAFARSFLSYLDIRFAVDEADVTRIPAGGPAMVVANHPYGIVEGLILTALLDRVRPDFKILANDMLGAIPEMCGRLILVNPFETRAAHIGNRAPVREVFTWLRGGGLLAVFPAGEVAHLDWKQHSVTDPPWKTAAARIALRARCPVVPIFFAGANSVPFQLAGTIHPGLRTASLAREFHRMSGKTVRLRIGNPIPFGVLAVYPDPEQATGYLRSRTFFLSNWSVPIPAAQPKPKVGPVALVDTPARIAHEITALPPECEVTGNSDYTVYVSNAAAIPRTLQEIGRCREVAFREAGEGTGEDVDLDRFDGHYQHMFLWHKTAQRVAGAYRMAFTADVLPRSGIQGLYTSTLFKFDPRFFERIGPALELGRSFIMPAYQKNYAPLLLLWKGITAVVRRRPEAPVLFGAVSISREYQAASRVLLTTYLSGHASHELARFVQPRRRFWHPVMFDESIRRFAAMAADIEHISLSIADIEHDAKGVPVLLRQYLKAGGHVLGFNVDRSFSEVLDALVVTDLRRAPLPLLERCMGRPEARAFLAFHRPVESSVAV